MILHYTVYADFKTGGSASGNRSSIGTFQARYSNLIFWEKNNTPELLTEAEQELLALCISAGTYGVTDRLTYLRKRLFADKEIHL